MLEKLYSATS